jgi:hypothetical protein
MTFVGKILVILIMAFALLFLGLSTVVFTTHTNWKDATKKEKDRANTLQTEKSSLDEQLKGAQAELEKAKADHQSALGSSDARIKQLEDEVKRDEAEASAARSKLETANESAKAALVEAADRRKETEQLRDQKSAVEKQANEFKIQQTELNDKIRELERQNKTLDDNNKDLRDRVGKLSTLLRRANLSDDISSVTGLENPPPVQGEVTRVDAQNRRVQISIGSDDGLVPNHELYLIRTKPEAKYLGRIRIQSVDPDQAVGTVIGRTVQGIKIQEGDIVSSTIRPRS